MIVESLRGIEAFVRTVDAGSFSAAARQLGVSPVAVSRNVARLERNLGVQLLQRTTHTLSLTDEGRQLCETARASLAALAAACEATAERQSAPAGLVRVTTIVGFGRLYVVPLLAEFHARYPRVQVELVMSDRVVDTVLEGFDVGIRIGAAPQTSMVVRKLADISRVICAAPEYLARRGVPHAPDEIAWHDCIRHRSASTGRLTVWELRRDDPVSIVPEGPVTLNDLLAVGEAAVAGLGLAQLPAFIAAPHLRSGRLLPVLEGYSTASVPLVMFYPPRHRMAARVHAFTSFIRARLENHPDLALDMQRMAALSGTRLAPRPGVTTAAGSAPG